MSFKLLEDKKMNVLSMAEAFSEEEASSILLEMRATRRQESNLYTYFYSPIYPDAHSWIYERVSSIVLDMNINNYRFKLSGVSALHYVEVGKDDFLEWSMDLVHSDRETNKLTVHIMLNDDYEGGNLSILNPHPTVVSARAGLMVVFPSFVLSKQESTTGGVKRMLVGTVTGLPFS